METCRDIAAARAVLAEVRQAGRRIGLVPTMGALHRAHVSLMDAARRDGTFVVVSIFVNPTQFGPNEDFDRYPRDEAGDLEICEGAGVGLVFMPAVDEMYRPDAVTAVRVAKLTEGLCGASRSGHFDGVATVVAKLFNIVQPDAAYFGEKDYQQLQVIRRMVRDLDMPIEIVGCPIVREADGLAVSSRNKYLSPEQRGQALCLSASLRAARERILAGESDAGVVVEAIRDEIEAAGPAEVDYISIVHPESLESLARIERRAVLALAVRIDKTRLIDNLLVDRDSQPV